ncbi:MAG: CapA family protein [Bacilli bacterium]|nr:CapA family protein [Bacilli bacterium]
MKKIRISKKVFSVIFTGVLVVLSVISGYLLFTNSFYFDGINFTIRKPKVYEAKMFMVGDALIHQSVYYNAGQNGNGYDFKPMIELIKPISSSYDLAYYNQETILGGTSLGLSHYPRFNSPQEVGDAMIDAGFNVVSLATNHTMDKGEAGVLASVNYWNSKKDVVTSGQWSSYEERDKVRVYEKNNIKYAFFSYTTLTNGLNTPYGKDYLNNVYSDSKAKNDIEKVKDKVDVIIVAMHWGVEYSMNVSSEQERIANYLSNLGVDLIIGAHPHVVEAVEYINNGQTFVIYSLGNFISGQIGVDKLTGLMMEVTIRKEVDTRGNTKVSIVNPKADLIYTRYNMNSNNWNFKVFPYSQLNDNILPSYKSYYEKYKAVVSSRYPELQWGITGA